MSSATFTPSGDLDESKRLGGYPTIEFPDGWTLSTSWQRAQRERDQGGPINDAERTVWLTGSDSPRRVVFALDGRSLRCECPCQSFAYRHWCAHVASLWWRWGLGRISVTHLTTGRTYHAPPAWLSFGADGLENAETLTPAELDVWLHVEVAGTTQAQFARETDRSPGTIWNLLDRARRKLEAAL